MHTCHFRRVSGKGVPQPRSRCDSCQTTRFQFLACTTKDHLFRMLPMYMSGSKWDLVQGGSFVGRFTRLPSISIHESSARRTVEPRSFPKARTRPQQKSSPPAGASLGSAATGGPASAHCGASGRARSAASASLRTFSCSATLSVVRSAGVVWESPPQPSAETVNTDAKNKGFTCRMDLHLLGSEKNTNELTDCHS